MILFLHFWGGGGGGFEGQQLNIDKLLYYNVQIIISGLDNFSFNEELKFSI